MNFKGSQIIETMAVRKVVTDMICEIIMRNAGYMHYIHSKGLPLLIKALKTGGPKKEISKMFHIIDVKMNFLFREFQRYRNFLAPLKLIQNT